MTPENDVNVAQPEVEDIEVEVTETDAPEQEASSSNDDELENYTKSVSKRINKLNARNRETEEPSLAFDYLNSITAVDYFHADEKKAAKAPWDPHLEVVYHLFSMQHKHNRIF